MLPERTVLEELLPERVEVDDLEVVLRVLPLEEERVCAIISGATSIAKARMMEAAVVIILLIAS